MIDPTTVQRIKDAADILDVVSEFVPLKRRGVSHIGCCPFHNEKTPSFNVTPSKGIYKCFGCGVGGDATKFIMEHEGLSYPEALKFLAKKYHIPIEEKKLSPEQKQHQSDRESMFVLNEYAQKYFRSVLLNSPEGQAVGMSYLKERQINTEMQEKFLLGYSLNQRTAFTDEALKKGYKKTYLEKTGLTKYKEDWYTDGFRARLIFPIRDLGGKIAGFGGRILNTQNKKVGKYLNSSDSETYNKSQIVYGLYEAKRAISNAKECILVEGYTDVIALHQIGIEQVVSSSGTSLTQGQIKQIGRFTKDITVIYDGDAAGINASLKGIDLILKEGLHVKVVSLPDGEDPDSFSKKVSKQDFIDHLATHKTDFIQFKTKLLMDEAANDPIQKAAAINSILTSVSVIPDNITREVYMDACSDNFEIPKASLYTEVEKIISQRNIELEKQQRSAQRAADRQASLAQNTPQALPQANNQQPAAPQVSTSLLTAQHSPQELALMQLLIRFAVEPITIFNRDTQEVTEHTLASYIVSEIEYDELEIRNPVFQEILNRCKLDPAPTTACFLESPSPELQHLVELTKKSSFKLSDFWTRHGNILPKVETKLREIADKELTAFKRDIILKRLQSLEARLKQTTDEEEQTHILQQWQQLKQIERQFAKDQGIQ